MEKLLLCFTALIIGSLGIFLLDGHDDNERKKYTDPHSLRKETAKFGGLTFASWKLGHYLKNINWRAAHPRFRSALFATKWLGYWGASKASFVTGYELGKIPYMHYKYYDPEKKKQFDPYINAPLQ